MSEARKRISETFARVKCAWRDERYKDGFFAGYCFCAVVALIIVAVLT